MFLNQNGKQFAEVSGVSGIDHDGDSRSFAILDFDRDGWSDIAMVNNNAPLLQLFRNKIGERNEDHHFIAIRFMGGNHTNEPSDQWSNRDGIGCTVRVELETGFLVREYRSGEGLAAQNSATMLVGLGQNDLAKKIVVSWPSGKTQTISNVNNGTLVTFFENPLDSESGSGSEQKNYLDKRLEVSQPVSLDATSSSGTISFSGHSPDPDAKIHVYSTMATWCTACISELPEFRNLADEFGSQFAIYGVSVDLEDSDEKLAEFHNKFSPPYEILNISSEELDELKSKVDQSLGNFGTPITIVADRDQRIIHIEWGPPSLSDIRRLLESVGH